MKVSSPVKTGTCPTALSRSPSAASLFVRLSKFERKDRRNSLLVVAWPHKFIRAATRPRVGVPDLLLPLPALALRSCARIVLWREGTPAHNELAGVILLSTFFPPLLPAGLQGVLSSFARVLDDMVLILRRFSLQRLSWHSLAGQKLTLKDD